MSIPGDICPECVGWMDEGIPSLLAGGLWSLEQFLQLLLEDLVGAFLGLDVVLMGLTVGLLLLLVLQLHITDLLLQVVHLLLQLLRLPLQRTDLVLHVLLLLLSLQRPSHPEGDR
jgi:hypothetical protein